MGDAIVKPKGDLYETSDQMMCEVLMMSGFAAVKVSPGGDGNLTYFFQMSEVWPTIEDVLTGKGDKVIFKLTDWWKAKMTWQMNLRHISHVRRQK